MTYKVYNTASGQFVVLAEYEALLARIGELEGLLDDAIAFHEGDTSPHALLEQEIATLRTNNEAMKRVVEAAQRWHGFGAMLVCVSDKSCTCDYHNLINALEEYELSL